MTVVFIEEITGKVFAGRIVVDVGEKLVEMMNIWVYFVKRMGTGNFEDGFAMKFSEQCTKIVQKKVQIVLIHAFSGEFYR